MTLLTLLEIRHPAQGRINYGAAAQDPLLRQAHQDK